MKTIFKMENKVLNREPYKTKQKELITSVVLATDKDFTIKELFSMLSKKEASIGLTTVYRTVSFLEEEGTIIRSIDPDGTVRYRKSSSCDKLGHCYLRCSACGKITHADCGVMNKLAKHFKKTHHFVIDQKNITIYGICNQCKKGTL